MKGGEYVSRRKPTDEYLGKLTIRESEAPSHPMNRGECSAGKAKE